MKNILAEDKKEAITNQFKQQNTVLYSRAIKRCCYDIKLCFG